MGLFSKQEPQQYEANGEKMQCVYCKNDYFFKQSSLVPNESAKLWSLMWASESADCFVCSKCGFIHWFIL